MMEEEGQFIEGLEWCEFIWAGDDCWGWEECNATLKWYGQEYSGDCDEMQDLVGYVS